MLTDGGFDPAALKPLSFAALRDRLHFTDIEVRLQLANPAPLSVAVLGRLRGALGRWLLQRAASTEIEAARCALFESSGRLSRSLDLPMPWLSQFDQSEDQVLLRLRLFANGQAHAAVLATAMEAVMGLAPAAHPLRCAASPLAVQTVSRGVTASHAAGPLSLRFLTPLSQRRDQRTHAAPQTVLRGILRRVGGIAALYGWRPDQAIADLHALLAERFGRVAWSEQDIALSSWQRGSARQDRHYRVEGVAGTLMLHAPPGELAPLFDLGVALHAGARATVGHGRYVLEIPRSGNPAGVIAAAD